MTNVSYNNNIPDAPNNPSTDQPKMKVNTNAIDQILNIDHVSFNTINGGYHKVIHLVKQITVPPQVSGFGQLYVADYDALGTITADQQLFYKSGNTVVGNPGAQLTGSFAGADGYAWMGGMLVQWGHVTFGAPAANHKTATITFASRAGNMIKFPSACFVVIPGLEVSATGNLIADNTIAIRDFSTTQFRYVYNGGGTGSSAYPGFWWVAIGN